MAAERNASYDNTRTQVIGMAERQLEECVDQPLDGESFDDYFPGKGGNRFGSSQPRENWFGNGETQIYCLQLECLPLERNLRQGGVTADSPPDAFAIQTVSEVVDAFGAIDRLTIDKSV